MSSESTHCGFIDGSLAVGAAAPADATPASQPSTIASASSSDYFLTVGVVAGVRPSDSVAVVATAVTAAITVP